MVEDLRGELLTQELPVLIRNAIDTSDISEIIKDRLTKEQRNTLENEAFGEAQNFLNFTQREVNDLAKARAFLFEHEGRSPSAKSSQARVAHTPNLTNGSSADETSGTTTAASEASPHRAVPFAKTVGEKDSLRLALVMLAFANLVVLGCIFGTWVGWNRAVDLGWLWKLLIAAPCYAAAISIAAKLVIAADQRMATTVPGLPRRSLDGGTPRVAGGLLLGSSAISAIIAFFDTLGREWVPSTHTITLVGAFIVAYLGSSLSNSLHIGHGGSCYYSTTAHSGPGIGGQRGGSPLSDCTHLLDTFRSWNWLDLVSHPLGSWRHSRDHDRSRHLFVVSG